MDDSDLTPVPLESQPEMVEMDRSATSPQENPPMESLASKLKAHYQKGMRKPKPSAITSTFTPEAVNRIAVPLFLFTILSTFKIGVFDVMPLIYEGNDTVILLQQALVAFICGEMLANWFGIRYVDSSYSRYIQRYGRPKSCSPSVVEKTITTQKNSGDSSVAKLLPLKTETVNENRLKMKRSSIGTYLTSVGQLVRNASTDLAEEADIANSEMNKEIQSINNRSIIDLLKVSQEGQNQQPVESLATPKRETNTDNTAVTSPTPFTTSNGEIVTKTYPYWSWTPCYHCGYTRPPRCHHCPLCHTCILKRDHHCFFAGSCVGYRNHRFFFVFLIWAWLGCVYATLHGFPYIGYFLWSEMSYWDIFFPFAVFRFFLGYTSFQAALSVTTLTLLLYFDFLTTVFIYAHTRLISWGVTSFEKVSLKNSIEIQDTRKLSEKVRAVFGPYWFLCFLFPTNFFFEPEEDPVEWPGIKVYRH